MEKSYESDLATHIGPESRGAVRESSVEALTGERAGRVFFLGFTHICVKKSNHDPYSDYDCDCPANCWI
jgi:hypothetical protein